MLYQYMVKRGIERRLTDDCEGCRFNCPGQRDHMGTTGCLQPWEERVDVYGTQVQANISVLIIQEMYHRVLTDLNLPLPRADIGAAVDLMLQQNPPSVISASLKGPDNTPWDYRRVFVALVD